ncbi:MAG: hypothetical protein JJV96_00910 [Alphaproteobacteria bacterium]|nr:hypothetical protein [Alphaproteobacteria bacterium]
MYISGVYCNATFDSILCWPVIPANSTTKLPCPPLRGLDTSSKFVYL